MRVRNQVTFAMVPEWILSADVSAQAIRLYAVLNREATKAGRGRVHPSRRELADAMHVKQSTVDRALDDLQRIGALEVSARVNKLGQTSNDYLVRQMPKDAEQMMTPLPIYEQGGVINGGEGPLVTSEQPKDKNSRTKSSRVLKHTSPEKQDDAIFEKTWSRYPPRNGKKLSKAKAAAAWNRLSDDDRAKARIAIANYAAACDAGTQMARDAFRWLRDRDFEDWLEPATLARASPNGSKHRGIDAKWERTE